jgi:hypothetical protein
MKQILGFFNYATNLQGLHEQDDGQTDEYNSQQLVGHKM